VYAVLSKEASVARGQMTVTHTHTQAESSTGLHEKRRVRKCTGASGLDVIAIQSIPVTSAGAPSIHPSVRPASNHPLR